MATTKHGLMFEGAPFTANGQRANIGTSGVGHARCWCGEQSPQPLPSGRARRAWHRDHKAALVQN
jgi:hypothetical protein